MIMHVHLCMCVRATFQLLTDFHEIYYESYISGGHHTSNVVSSYGR
jgi:hypothetical protein